jgi:hypothetical protein
MHGSIQKKKERKYGGFQISCCNEKKMDIQVRREKGSELLVRLLIGSLSLHIQQCLLEKKKIRKNIFCNSLVFID